MADAAEKRVHAGLNNSYLLKISIAAFLLHRGVALDAIVAA